MIDSFVLVWYVLLPFPSPNITSFLRRPPGACEEQVPGVARHHSQCSHGLRPSSVWSGVCLDCIFDYLSKTLSVQGRAAHQRAIHVRLAHQLPSVGWPNAAAILNANTPRRRFVKQLDEQSADECVGFLSLLRAGCLASANRPDRFIRDNGLNHLICIQSGQTPTHLGRKDFLHVACFTLREGFANANNRLERRGMSRPRFSCN